MGYYKFLFIFLLLFIAPQTYAQAVCEASSGSKCFYVTPTGSDSNPGTFAAPFKTFRPALIAANPGDFIYARGGTYTDANSMTGWSGSSLMIRIMDDSSSSLFIKNGLPGKPITVRNYPSEKPMFTGAAAAILVQGKSYWTIQGFDIDGRQNTLSSLIYVGGRDVSTPTHDIVIRDNNVHHLVGIYSGAIICCNVGIIKVNRGDVRGAGPYNIYIWNNKIHDAYDPGSPGAWSSTADPQHYGGITFLSSEVYDGYDAGNGNGYIEIKNNEIYHVPQLFYFKNPMQGPILIEGNTMHDSGWIGDKSASNVTMRRNLVWGVSRGWVKSGYDPMSDSRINMIAGQNALVEYNTFVSLDSLFNIWNGAGHTVRNNVFFGLTGRAAGAGWDTSAYIGKSSIWPDPTDPAQSLLQKVKSDNNCFLVGASDALSVSRNGASTHLDHYTFAQARQVFGFDPNSKVIVETNQANVFVNPGAHDYHLLSSVPCQSMGAYAGGGTTPTPTSTPTLPPSGSLTPTPTPPPHPLGNVLDIRNFGARCDGSDNAAAVQSAINALKNGDTLNVSCMVGTGSTGLDVVGKTGITIQGTAAGTGFKALAPAHLSGGFSRNHVFLIDSCTNCIFKNLEFQLNFISGAFDIKNSVNTTIDGNKMYNGGTNADVMGIIGGINNHNNKYINNLIDTGRTSGGSGATLGMYLGNWHPSQLEYNPTIENNVIRGTDWDGLAMENVGGIVRNNIFEDGKRRSFDARIGAGFKITGAGYIPLCCSADFSNVDLHATTLIEGNQIRRMGIAGVQLNDVNNLIFRNNIFENNQGPGIMNYEGMDNTIIEGNTFRNNNIFYASNNGYEPAALSLISCCVGSKTGITGINNITIRNNIIENTNTQRSQAHAIKVSNYKGTMTNVVISGNTCKNSVADGILVEGGSNGGALNGLTIVNNVCTGNGGAGIHLKRGSAPSVFNVTVCGNDLSNNAGGPLVNNLGITANNNATCPAGISTPSPTLTPTPTPTATPAPSGGTTILFQDDFETCDYSKYQK